VTGLAQSAPDIAQALKDSMARWPSGVAVVTASARGVRHGVTVSSFISVSVTPPLVLVSLMNQSNLLPLVDESGRFAVSVLSSDQEQLSQHFATSGREPSATAFDAIEHEVRHEMPTLAGSQVILVSELEERIVAGDHTLLIGRVVEAKSADEGDALVYYNRGYRRLV